MKPRSRILLSLILASVLAPQAATQGTLKWVEAHGEGASRGAATADALAQAVIQFYGGRLKGQKETSNTIRQEITNEATDFKSHQESIDKLRQITKGFVRTYKILNSKKGEDGLWETQIRAGLISLDPNDPRAGRRPTLAVVGFTWGGTAYAGGALPLNEVLEDLASNATTAAGRNKIFTTLTRAYQKEANRELSALTSGETATQEAVKLGYRLGSDFLLKGSLEEFAVKVIEVRLGDRTIPTEQAKARIKFEIVNITSGATRAFSDVAAGWTQHDLNDNRAFERRRYTSSSPEALLMEMLTEELSKTLEDAYRNAPWMKAEPDASSATQRESGTEAALITILERIERRLAGIEERLDKIESGLKIK